MLCILHGELIKSFEKKGVAMRCPECGHEFKNPSAVKGGLTKSKARRKASAMNGRLGGRPKKFKAAGSGSCPYQLGEVVGGHVITKINQNTAPGGKTTWGVDAAFYPPIEVSKKKARKK